MKTPKYTINEFSTAVSNSRVCVQTPVGIEVHFIYYWTDLYGIMFVLTGYHLSSVISSPIRIRTLSEVYRVYSELYDNNLELLQKLEK